MDRLGLEQTNVLVVDPRPCMAEALAKAFRKVGAHVATVSTFGEAIEVFDYVDVSLVILNLRVERAEALKLRIEARRIPIVLFHDAEADAKSLVALVDMLLSKPSGSDQIN